MASDENESKIASSVIDFDKILIETLMGNRERRYNMMFKPHLLEENEVSLMDT
jgi:hypothetical protein